MIDYELLVKNYKQFNNDRNSGKSFSLCYKLIHQTLFYNKDFICVIKKYDDIDYNIELIQTILEALNLSKYFNRTGKYKYQLFNNTITFRIASANFRGIKEKKFNLIDY